MPDPRDDLVRRGDVLDMIDAESHGDEGLAIIDSRDIHALPADPVAAAALALAKKLNPWRYVSFDMWECLFCTERGFWVQGGPACDLKHAETCAWGAYRAALAGRERGR